jgi:drug/metabolite transporter (DMT)-like permease
MRFATLRADVLLLLAAVIWGTGFVAQRLGMAHVGPMTFTGVRFAIGSLVLLPVIYARRSNRSETDSRQHASLTHPYLLGGMLAGFVLCVAVGLQQIGIVYTTAGKAGFITGLYVVFVPMIGLFLRHRVRAATWIGAGLAVVGLYVLSITGTLQVNRGDCYVLACAVVFAVHFLVIGWLSPQADSLKLAAMQFAVTAVLSLIAALIAEEITLEAVLAAKWAILYGAVFPVGIAFTLQIAGQREAPPAHAAILLSLEAVFAAIAGGLILSETLSEREVLGCALMLAGVLASQLRGSARKA